MPTPSAPTEPTNYYRFNEPTGTSLVRDLVGSDDMTAYAGVTRGVNGAMRNETDKASSLNGTPTGYTYGQTTRTAPNTFTVEAWFRTSTTKGGAIIAFGDPLNGTRGTSDRVVYMDNSGRIWFGVNNGTNRSVHTTGFYNNNKWHLVTASLGPGGMRLFLNRNPVPVLRSVTSGKSFLGDWQVGRATLSGRPSMPTSHALLGSVDEVAIYPTALSATRIAAHYAARG